MIITTFLFGIFFLIISILMLNSSNRKILNASIIVFVISIPLTFIFGVMSFLKPIPNEPFQIKPSVIAELKNTIIVETDYKVFNLEKISDRDILKAKKIYLQTYKNSWGISLDRRTHLRWEM